MVRTLLIILLIILILGSLPTWGYSSGWGYYPSGGLIILLIVITVAAMDFISAQIRRRLV